MHRVGGILAELFFIGFTCGDLQYKEHLVLLHGDVFTHQLFYFVPVYVCGKAAVLFAVLLAELICKRHVAALCHLQHNYTLSIFISLLDTSANC